MPAKGEDTARSGWVDTVLSRKSGKESCRSHRNTHPSLSLLYTTLLLENISFETSKRIKQPRGWQEVRSPQIFHQDGTKRTHQTQRVLCDCKGRKISPVLKSVESRFLGGDFVPKNNNKKPPKQGRHETSPDLPSGEGRWGSHLPAALRRRRPTSGPGEWRLHRPNHSLGICCPCVQPL